MIYYGTILLFFIALTIVPIVVGFLFKNKYIRYFCWLISIPFLSLTNSTIRKHSTDINNQTSDFLGNYIIDTSKSVYKNGNLTNHQKLTLKVNSNNTFLFSDTSFSFQKKARGSFMTLKTEALYVVVFLIVAMRQRYWLEMIYGDFNKTVFEMVVMETLFSLKR